MDSIKNYIRNFNILNCVIRYILDLSTNLALKFLPGKYGVRRYNRMQVKAYTNYTMTYDDAIHRCVGRFEEHERYPYEKYLLDKYEGNIDIALDFGCGIGRMMNRMLHHAQFVHGVDISEKNLQYAHRYLLSHGWPENRFRLFQSNGLGCNIDSGVFYDFIYSTIVLQHIAVHKIRYQIISDMFSMLKEGGICSIQMGFGWDNGTHWFDNAYGARSTNAGHDVSIPNETHLDSITKDLIGIGFSSIEYVKNISPHQGCGLDYHPEWLFIHMRK